MQSKSAHSPAEDLVQPLVAARIAGVSVDTIKRWEKAGRISSIRTPTNHRRYRRADVEALIKPASAAS
ncbi:MerR family transcriptional regulator [Tomitella gaofuii]|uniref:MerR family transcriptional regulator n=1 Tax=Tomitella gaofuii TaxID=2760083 RepID=UPI0015F84504|nr:helix-turn-helix domain-containing protein [Tomitella gaofuii]